MNVQLYRFAVVLLTETKVFRNFWMQSLSICRLQQTFLQSRVLTWMATIVRHSSDDEPFSALAFKIMTDPFVGKLAYFRVYSGTMNSGSYVLNATKEKKSVLDVSFRCMLTNVWSWIKFTPVISQQLSVSNSLQQVIQSVMTASGNP